MFAQAWMMVTMCNYFYKEHENMGGSPVRADEAFSFWNQAKNRLF